MSVYCFLLSVLKNGQIIKQECSEDQACLTKGFEVVFKFNAWTKSQNLICDKRHMRSQGKLISLLVNSVTCFSALNLSDLLGRKTTIFTCIFLILSSLTLAFLAENYFLKMALIGVAYGCEGSFASLFVFIMNEVTCTLLLLRCAYPHSLLD